MENIDAFEDLRDEPEDDFDEGEAFYREQQAAAWRHYLEDMEV